MASYTFTPETWNPSAAPGISAAELTRMDTGIANASTYKVDLDGSTVMSAALKLALALGGSNKVVAEWNATDGKKYQLIITTGGKLVVWNATDSVNCAEFGPAAGQITAAGVSVLKADGSIAMTAPLALAAGNQETGKMGGRFYTPMGNSMYAVVNFKMLMTNTPSSITAGTPDFSEHFVSLTATFISKTGFALTWGASGGASTDMSSWIGPYTTVGNCVRAVDGAMRTFTHHCDQCGLTREGLYVDHDVALRGELGSDGAHKPLALSRPGAYGMSILCPCGATEMLTTSLTREDASLLDLSPDGLTTVGELARQVRALQAALSLPMAE